jgi:hypothetical protein
VRTQEAFPHSNECLLLREKLLDHKFLSLPALPDRERISG